MIESAGGLIPFLCHVFLILFGGFQSTNEVLGALFVFTVLATLYNLATTFKILESFDGNDWPIKHTIRPLIPMVAILIRYFTL